jgi:hypothetical protein
MIWYNIQINYNFFLTNKEKIQAENRLKVINEENLSLQDKSDYYKSPLFKEQAIKADNLFKKGEKGIRLGIKEGVRNDKNDTSFIKKPEKAQENNIQKWINCLTKEVQAVGDYCK